MKTILIVEDDAAIGDVFLKTILLETPHPAVLVSDGKSALSTVEEIIPDLFVVDYHLPDMSGIELYDQVHAIEGFEDIPTILVSAGVLEHDIGSRKLVGISKPVDLDKLLDIVEDLLA